MLDTPSQHYLQIFTLCSGSPLPYLGSTNIASVWIPCWIWPRLIVIAGNLLAVCKSASWQHDSSFLHELVKCRHTYAKGWRHRDLGSGFSTASPPCPNAPGEACAALPVRGSCINSHPFTAPQAYASSQTVFKLLLTAKYSLLHLLPNDDLK